jgi:Tol biopolymer transport system component
MRRSGLLALLCLLAVAAPAAARNRYANARASIRTHNFTFGQAPVFLPDGRVVVGKDYSGGTNGSGTQIYVQQADGSGRKCLTCDLPGPNNVPSVQPGGKWILFHSWNGHHLTLGSPGYGGLGSELWVMRADGTRKTRLTGLDVAHGAGEGEDDYHAYWSPDGTQLDWAHLNWNFVDDGGDGNWDIRVARFDDSGAKPKLADERVVRPANGHWYETQWWKPDGSGFLYTESSGTAENTELYFCRLTAQGCKVTHLSDFNPGWDEQGLFTPDGKNVVFMSTRAHPGFYNAFSSLAQNLGLGNSVDYILILPIFEAGFLTPVAPESTDLYLLNLRTKAIRRLTHDGDAGWVIPEFTWNPTNRYLFFTELKVIDDERIPLPVQEQQLAHTLAFLSNPGVGSPEANTTSLIKFSSRTRELRFHLSRRARR